MDSHLVVFRGVKSSRPFNIDACFIAVKTTCYTNSRQTFSFFLFAKHATILPLPLTFHLYFAKLIHSFTPSTPQPDTHFGFTPLITCALFAHIHHAFNYFNRTRIVKLLLRNSLVLNNKINQ